MWDSSVSLRCMHACSVLSDSATPWTVAHQAPQPRDRTLVSQSPALAGGFKTGACPVLQGWSGSAVTSVSSGDTDDCLCLGPHRSCPGSVLACVAWALQSQPGWDLHPGKFIHIFGPQFPHLENEGSSQTVVMVQLFT